MVISGSPLGWVGRWMSTLRLGFVLGWVGGQTYRYEGRPLHAQRIRCLWEAGECAAIGLVVGLVGVGELGPRRSEDRQLHGEPDPAVVGVAGRVGGS